MLSFSRFLDGLPALLPLMDVVEAWWPWVCRRAQPKLYLNITIGHGAHMHTTNLRKVGGSVMLAVPPALLDVLHLTAGAKVGLAVSDGRLVVEPNARPRYTMTELLAASDYSQPQTASEREWLDASAVGRYMV